MIYCINLRRRPDRWRRMTRRFLRERLNVTRFDAIDGGAIDPETLPPSLISLQYDTTENAGWDPLVRPGVVCRLTSGEVGCILSHLAVWDDLLSSRRANAIVLEDDVDLAPKFQAAAARLLRHRRSWDLIYLGYQTAGEPPAAIKDSGLGKPEHLFGTFAYAISRRGAARLMALLPITGPLDVFLSSSFSRLAVWCAVPPLVQYQPRSMRDSDIAHSAHAFARRGSSTRDQTQA